MLNQSHNRPGNDHHSTQHYQPVSQVHLGPLLSRSFAFHLRTLTNVKSALCLPCGCGDGGGGGGLHLWPMRLQFLYDTPGQSTTQYDHNEDDEVEINQVEILQGQDGLTSK